MVAAVESRSRKIGYSRAERGRSALVAFGCTDIVGCTGDTPDWAALRAAIESLRFGDVFAVWTERELGMPAYVLRDFVNGHGARVVELQRSF